jgi:hypothetical protein
MSRTLNVAKFAGLVTLIGLIDVGAAIRPVLLRALPIVALLVLILFCNQLGVEIEPGYMKPLQFDGTGVLALIPLPLLAIAPFSFGWLVSLYAFITVFCFVLYSSVLPYDHATARIAILTSLFTFMVPALFIRRRALGFSISDRTMERILNVAIIIAFAVIGADAAYGFRIVGFVESMMVRGEILRPAALNYLSNILTCAVLPFTMAWSLDRKRWYLATVSALVLGAFFPIMLSKIVLFAPLWTIAVYNLFKYAPPKVAAVISLAAPLLGTFLYFRAFDNWMPFYIVDIRMIAMPAIAIDRYLAFFSSHPLTHFCQINVVRHFVGCPYRELGVLMNDVYAEGNFNASFFATEGIASVGIALTPIATFACGLVVAAGNIASSRLSPALIAAASGVFLNVLMNVPLSVAMVSNGGALLFLLFFITRE